MPNRHIRILTQDQVAINSGKNYAHVHMPKAIFNKRGFAPGQQPRAQLQSHTTHIENRHDYSTGKFKR